MFPVEFLSRFYRSVIGLSLALPLVAAVKVTKAQTADGSLVEEILQVLDL